MQIWLGTFLALAALLLPQDIRASENSSVPLALPPGNGVRQARRVRLQDSCTTTDGGAGTCMTRFNCARQSGTIKGYCGTYGVCCETTLRCAGVSKLKRTIISSSATTSVTSDTCQYTIERYNANVCQLLIEFQKFELMQPTLTEASLECTDYLRVDKYVLCGVNTGQHIYLQFDAASGLDVISLQFVVPSRWPQSSWSLVLTQLECPVQKNRPSASGGGTLMPFLGNNYVQDLRTIFLSHHSDLDLIAPIGCDQYYRQTEGTIRSFNHQDGGSNLYMASLNYVICVKPLSTAQYIQYTVQSFSMSIEDPLNAGVDSDCHSDIYTEDRRQDYLMIPQSHILSNDVFQPTYYCGHYLQQYPIIAALPPFIMYFSSDGYTDATETGFSINYRVVTNTNWKQSYYN